MSKLIAERVEDLVLARLSASPRGIIESEVRRQLRPYIDASCTASEWRALLTETLDRLTSAGQIEKKPLRLTKAGQKRLLKVLGWRTLPHGNWRQLKSKILRAMAMGIRTGNVRKRPPEGELSTRILVQSYQLAVPKTPTRLQAIDALVKRELGLSGNGRLSPREIRAHVLAKLLDANPKLGAERLSDLLAAKAVGARKPDADGLRVAVVRRWLVSPSPAVSAAKDARALSSSAAAHKEPSAATDTNSLESFSTRVLETARAPSTKRFGDRKAFIFSVWQQISEDPQFGALGELGFKQSLVEANRQGLLTLSRADLVGAMDPNDVSRSEVQHLTATFHFINVDK